MSLRRDLETVLKTEDLFLWEQVEGILDAFKKSMPEEKPYKLLAPPRFIAGRKNYKEEMEEIIRKARER